MTAPRRPADIARVLRRWDLGAAQRIADELDALDGRWPTADEIASLRGDLAAKGVWVKVDGAVVWGHVGIEGPLTAPTIQDLIDAVTGAAPRTAG